MAHAITSPPMLRIKRSTQSGSKGMTAAYAAVYEESCSLAYYFAGAKIVLSGMQAGDDVDVRVRVKVTSGGSYIAYDHTNYTDAQPAGHQVCYITPIPDVYGVEIAMRQTAGVLLNIDTEFFDAKRIGLA
ncbi:MAG: hypothetical protein GF350_05730 [Chitinivibrionales bacterium]|nr:hypothetical protein [Chitinivibrionales bacterium]